MRIKAVTRSSKMKEKERRIAEREEGNK